MAGLFTKFAMRNSFSTTTPKVVSQTLTQQMPKRTFLTKAQYETAVPKDVQKVLEKTKLETQKQGVGECDFVASGNAKKLTEAMKKEKGTEPGAVKLDYNWTEDHSARLEKGIPAKVHARDISTPESEWSGNHAVTVVSKSTDGTKLVVHDPDTTHHPLTALAHKNGTAEVRHDLRLMTVEDVQKARSHVVGDDIVKKVEQPVDKTQPFLKRWGWF
jgi:hypothetical protein